MKRQLLTNSVAGAVAFAALVGHARAQCPADDLFEDNDDCASATVITAGVTSGLVAKGPVALGGTFDDDYFLIQNVPAGHDLVVQVLFTHSSDGDINVRAWDAPLACGLPQYYSYSSSDNELVTLPNGTGAAADFIVRIDASDENFDCKEYSIDVSFVPNPCLDPILEDGFEPNGDCISSPVLTMGSHALFLAPDSTDSFTVSVPAGDELVAAVTFEQSELGLYMALWEPLCGNFFSDTEHNEAGPGPFTLTSTYTNGTGAAKDVEVYLFNFRQTCGSYTLDLSSSPSPCLAAGVDDGREENDDCASAAPLSDGLHSGLFVSKSDPDYYAISVQPGDRLDVTATSSGVFPQVVGVLHQACNITDQVGVASAGSPSISYANFTGAPVDVLLTVEIPSFYADYCTDYELTIARSPEPCLQPGQDDGLEPNDDCASAVPLALGVHTGLFWAAGDPDFYAVTIPAGQDLVVDVTHAPGSNLIATVWSEPACADADPAFWTSDSGSLQAEFSNTLGAAQVVILELGYWEFAQGQGQICSVYDLSLSATPNACLGAGLEDSLEPNNDCASAVQLSSGTHQGLFLTDLNADYYTIDVQPGQIMTAYAQFTHASGDIDMALERADQCGDFDFLALSVTTTDDEFIQWVNTEGNTVTYSLWVLIQGGNDSSVTACNSYDLTILTDEPFTDFCFGDGTANVGNGMTGCPCGNEAPLGANEGCANSLGYGARLSRSGSASVVLDDLQITMSQARPMQPALLIQGASLVTIPFKDGLLCMGNPTERVEVMSTDASGTASTAHSIAANGHVGGGETRYYQVWYRDPGGVSPCGTGSNFSHGLFVNWQ